MGGSPASAADSVDWRCDESEMGMKVAFAGRLRLRIWMSNVCGSLRIAIRCDFG